MRFGWLATGSLVVVILAVGCSTSSDKKYQQATRIGSTSQAIEGGQDDTTHTFAVGVCIGVNPQNCGKAGGICSGALITPNLVVTARHCVSDVQEPINCLENPTFGGAKGPIFVTTAAQMDNATYRSATVIVPSDNHVCNEDIALLVLSSQVPASEATPITPGIQHLMWDPTYFLPIFTAVGYGKTGPTAGFNTSGQRRKRELISAYCVPGDLEHPPCPKSEDPEKPGTFIDPLDRIGQKEFIAGQGVCSGDSGSSAYEQKSFDKNAAVSFGVLSRGPEDSCNFSVYTRLDAHRDFIIEGAKKASNNWALYPEPAWTGPPTGAPTKTPDAGKPATSSSGSSGTATNLGIGEVCGAETECESKVCADIGDGSKICSQACDAADATSCPDGYSCKDDVCLPAAVPATAPATTTKTTEGCASAPGGGTSTGGWLLIAGALGLASAASRRRRNSTAHP